VWKKVSRWVSVSAPKGTPVEIINHLNEAIKPALTDPAFASRLPLYGTTMKVSSSAEFMKMIAEETEK
jgi:tripartite-type tricarboxylate transporter receptor subunit TctC